MKVLMGKFIPEGQIEPRVDVTLVNGAPFSCLFSRLFIILTLIPLSSGKTPAKVRKKTGQELDTVTSGGLRRPGTCMWLLRIEPSS